jgi:hypothetical protein
MYISPIQKPETQTTPVTATLFHLGFPSVMIAMTAEIKPVDDPSPRVSNIRKNNTANN